MKVGCKGVYITWTCYQDGEIQQHMLASIRETPPPDCRPGEIELDLSRHI